MQQETTKFSQLAELITKEIISALQEGNIVWSTPFAMAINNGLACNYLSGRPYEGFNQFYLSLKAKSRDYRTAQYLTYKQAQELGGQVRKGERGSVIIYWKVIEASSDEDEGEKYKKFYPLYFYVFNIDQIDGIEFCVPSQPDLIPGRNGDERCLAIVKGYQDCPAFTWVGGYPSYSPNADSINIPNERSFKSLQLYYSVLYHELIHSTGHESRLNRFTKQSNPAPFGSAEYSKEELIAELGAAFLCGAAGIYPDTKNHNAAYIDGWINALRRDYTLIITAANKALRAAHYILGIKGIQSVMTACDTFQNCENPFAVLKAAS